MKTIEETVVTEVKTWLDKNIAPELRTGSEVAELEKEAIEKVTHQCVNNAGMGYKFTMSEKEIIENVTSYFVNYFYN